MDPQLKQLLDANLELARENNDLLKKIRNTQRLGQIYRIVYWVVILGASYGAYQFVQPYIGSMLSIYTGGALDPNSLQGMSSMSQLKDIQDLVNGLK